MAARAPQAARRTDRVGGSEQWRPIWTEFAYAGTSIVSSAYRRDGIRHALDGFGFVVPAVEKRRILAGSFASVKFAGRAPTDVVLVRVFIGGACQSELADLADERVASDRGRGRVAFAARARAGAVVLRYRPLATLDAAVSLGHCRLVAQIEAKAAEVAGLGAGRQCLSRRGHSELHSQRPDRGRAGSRGAVGPEFRLAGQRQGGACIAARPVSTARRVAFANRLVYDSRRNRSTAEVVRVAPAGIDVRPIQETAA